MDCDVGTDNLREFAILASTGPAAIRARGKKSSKQGVTPREKGWRAEGSSYTNP